MSFLGMSYLEILVVALVAFVFLGPERMVGMARNLGKMVRTVRAMAADLPSIDDLDLDGTRERDRAGTRPAPTTDGGPRKSDEDRDEDGPVAFRASPPPPPAPVKRGEEAGPDSGGGRNHEDASENRS